ncbi:hypothetical protein DM01DRAFT_1382366 [Hesseltinella vesiculosa]|uniref:Nucleoporin Nup186/Nup192/Nup205 n=1 Tax=Hesseltinella vesiculosa TaxID=101127 RepID=A0A1X2GME7_9FUNG|nr:hypothetical protein DM01DRAFT_1382366 [Hesseltinella vesiculosa]
MSEEGVPTWQHGAYDLYNLLCQAEAFADVPTIRVLEEALEMYQQRFLNLFDDEPKNPKHRLTMQKEGKAYVDGKECTVEPVFVEAALALSDELEMNEYQAATLLQESIKLGHSAHLSVLAASFELYHNERSYLLLCLENMIKCIAKDDVQIELREYYAHYISDLMTNTSIPCVGTNNTSYPSKLLLTTKRLNTMAKSLEKNGSYSANTTASATTAPAPASTLQPLPQPQQPASKLNTEIVAARITRLTEERISLLEILYYLTSLHHLQSSDILDLIDYVAKSNLSTLTTPVLATTLLAGLSPKHKLGTPWAKDKETVQSVHDKIKSVSAWKVPVLQSMAALQWTTFMTHLAHTNPTLAATLPVQAKEAETLATQLMASCHVFGFLNDYFLSFRTIGEMAYETTEDDDVNDDDSLTLNGSKNTGLANPATSDGLVVDPTDYTKFKAIIRTSFEPFVLDEIEQMTTFIIRHLAHLLRDRAYQDEDTIDGLSSTSFLPLATPNATSPRQRPDLDSFLTLLANMYRGRCDEALWLWQQAAEGVDVVPFIKWLQDTVKLTSTRIASLQLFSSIACGHQAAAMAYDFFEQGSARSHLENSSYFSWGKLFGALRYYAKSLEKGAEYYITTDDEAQLKLLTLLLQQVVQYSRDARLALWNDPAYQTRDSLTKLVNSPVCARLRASLCNALAAFCSPWGGGVDDVGLNISLQVWSLVQNGDVFTATQPRKQQALPNAHQTSNNSDQDISGLLQELSLEKPGRSYHETISIVNLLANLIHKPTKWDQLQSGFGALPSSIPTDLGKGSANPGAAPYVSSVINDVFLAWKDLQYRHSYDKWQLVTSCLHVLENSLASLDFAPLLETLIAWKDAPGFRPELEQALGYYVTHPSFHLMIQILAGKPVLDQIFQIIHQAKPILLMENKISELHHTTTARNLALKYAKRAMVHSLRILYIVTRQQHLFENLLLKQLEKLSTRLSTGQLRLGDLLFVSWPSIVPLSQRMLLNNSVIFDLAGLLSCNSVDEEICFLSIKLLHSLSNEPDEPVWPSTCPREKVLRSGITNDMTSPSVAFGGLGSHVLTQLLSADPSAVSCLRQDVYDRLSIDQDEATTFDDYAYDSNNIPFWKARNIIGNKLHLNSEFDEQCMTTSIRLALLDMLVDNAAAGKTGPTLTSLILGLHATPTTLADHSSLPPAATTPTPDQRLCLDVVLDILRSNLLPSLQCDDDTEAARGGAKLFDEDKSKVPVTATNPVMTERCYALLYRVCAHASWSKDVMAYLQTSGNYFYLQLCNMLITLGDPKPFAMAAPSLASEVAPGEIVFNEAVVSSDPKVSKASVAKADALALRAILLQYAWQLKLLAIDLHGLPASSKDQAKKLLNVLFMTDPYQTGMKTIDVFLSLPVRLDFAWRDDLATDQANDHTYFKEDFTTPTYQVVSASGCTVIDLCSVYSYMRNCQFNLQDAGVLTSIDAIHAAENEMGQILTHLLVSNHVREIQHAQNQLLQAWLDVLQIAIVDHFDALPSDVYLPVLSHLLGKLLPLLDSPSPTLDSSITAGFSNALLLLVSNLLRRQQGKPQADRAIDMRVYLKIEQLFDRLCQMMQAGHVSPSLHKTLYATTVQIARAVANIPDMVGILPHMKQQLVTLRETFIDTKPSALATPPSLA